MTIDERVVLIRLSRAWPPRLDDPELYEKTRKWWRINPRHSPDYALAVHRGHVLAAYRIEGWEPHPEARRWAFFGSRDEELTRRYGGRDVSEYFARGDANPVRYLNCDAVAAAAFTPDRGGRDLVFDIAGQAWRAGAASTRCFRDIERQFSVEDALATVDAAAELMDDVRRRWPNVRGPQLLDGERELLGEGLLLAGGVAPRDIEFLCAEGNYRSNPRATFDLRRYGFQPPPGAAPSTVEFPSLDRTPVDTDASALSVDVRDVPVERQQVEFVQIRARQESRQATRFEHSLVMAFAAYLEERGDTVGSKTLRLDGAPALRVDLFNVSRSQLIEAKDEASREKIRMALGQLLDYGRHVEHGARAVLVPVRPTGDLESLLAEHDIALIWRDESGFRDNSGGAFV